MKTEILMKMSPAARETVIKLEAKLRVLNEELVELGAVEEMFNQTEIRSGGFLGDDDGL